MAKVPWNQNSVSALTANNDDDLSSPKETDAINTAISIKIIIAVKEHSRITGHILYRKKSQQF